MLKGLVNLFKCCKSQNRQQKRETQETINYRDTEKNQNDTNNNYEDFPNEKSVATYNTKESPTAACKDQTPNDNLKKKDMDIGSCNVHYQSKINIDQENKIDYQLNENNNNNKDKEEADLVNARNNKSNFNYKDNVKVNVDNHVANEIPKEKQEDDDRSSRSRANKNDIEEDFDKVIVPEKYIREDEKAALIWVSESSFFLNF